MANSIVAERTIYHTNTTVSGKGNRLNRFVLAVAGKNIKTRAASRSAAPDVFKYLTPVPLSGVST
jgi:hypothetical protein